MKIRQNPYSSHLLLLRDAINAPYRAKDFAPLLPIFSEFYDLDLEIDTDNIWEEVDRLDPETHKQFEKWLQRGNDHQMEEIFHEEAPLYLYFSGAKILPPSTWLVHFSPDAYHVAKRGFEYGQRIDDLYLLHYTKGRKRPEKEGWNFGFKALSLDSIHNAKQRNPKYGNEAVIFQAAGVEARHWGDDEHQVMFVGKDAQNIVYLGRHEGDDWAVYQKRRDTPILYGDFEKVCRWVIAHYEQYRDVLT